MTKSEERLRQVQQADRIGSFDFHLTANAVIASPEYLDLYGLSHDWSGTFNYENWICLVHPEDRPSIVAQTQQAFAAPSRYQLEYDFRTICTATQETLWITARTKLIRKAKGQFVRSLGA